MSESHRPAGEQGSAEREEQRVDTVPPPPGDEDAYSADTVIRDIPREALDAIRNSKQGTDLRKAMEQSGATQPSDTVSVIPDEEPAPTKTAAPAAAAKETLVADRKSVQKQSAAHADHAAGHAAVVIAPPVTGSELIMALAAAVVLIVVGFYVIGSAF
ncbi:MAG: hypothetical protein ABI461_23545 [Polyangiaceae bacterium]